jgi:hypothetical protein
MQIVMGYFKQFMSETSGKGSYILILNYFLLPKLFPHITALANEILENDTLSMKGSVSLTLEDNIYYCGKSCIMNFLRVVKVM